MIEGGKSPPDGRGLGKRTWGMLGSRVGGECMWRGNGENITANAKTGTQMTLELIGAQFCLYTLEVHMYPHV